MTPELSDDLAELIGIITGDGCISITKRYKELAILGDLTEEEKYYNDWVVPLFERTITSPLGLDKIIAKPYPKMSVYGIMTFNKSVVEFLLSLGLQSGSKTLHGLPACIKNGTEIQKKRFLRGLGDTDGSIYFEKNYSTRRTEHMRPKIKIECASKKMIEETIEICRDLGFTPYIRKPHKGKRDKNIMHGFVLYKVTDIERWMSKIGFKSWKHATKVELWKAKGACPPKTSLNERLELLASHSAKLKTLA